MNTFVHRLSTPAITATTVMCLAIAGTGQTNAPAASTVVQTPATAQPSTPEKTLLRRLPRRPSTPPATVTVVADQTEVAPQAVTIDHRLSEVKMLRLLQRPAR